MKYKVGQILYFVGAESARVIPGLIVEEVVRTTIEGKEKNYIIQLPDDKKTKIDMSKIKGEVFDSIFKLKEHMVQTAESAIQNMIDTAVALADKSYDQASLAPPEEPPKEDKLDSELENTLGVSDDKVQQQFSHDIVSVDMGNGMVGKVSIDDLNKIGV